jgi:hypothetical protein
MESEKFDALARRVIGDGSRRGILRGGIGALAASALAVVGLGDDAEGKKKKKKGPNKKRNSGNSNKRKRQPAICYRGETITTTRGKFQDGWYEGATQGACICPADRPITCGLGCCPNNFPQCCATPAAFGSPGEATGSTCAPNTSRCCTVANGGGACDSPTPQCCPPTNQQPRGSCAAVDATCCNSAQGGGSCPAPFSQCCPVTPNFPIGSCCRPGQQCCTGPAGVQSNCPAGLVCNVNGCCTAGVLITGGEEDGAPRQAGSDKVGIPV